MAPHHIHHDNRSFMNRKRPYSSGYHSTPNKRYKKELPVEKTLKKPLGELIKVLTDTELETAGNSFRVESSEYVASYNWLGCEEPTIIVPGSPPVISMAIANQTQLEPDRDGKFLDPNSAKCPDNPFDPAVRAISHFHPTFETSSIDIVACNKTLGHLFDFVDGRYCSFRFDAQLFGTTLFLTRREHPPTATYRLSGYSQSFARQRTYWDDDVEDSITHQRMMKYRLGCLNVLIRYEVDGHFVENEEAALKEGQENDNIEDATAKEVTEMDIDTSQGLGNAVKLEGSLKLEGDLDHEEQSAIIAPPPEKATPLLSATNLPSQTRINAHHASNIPALNIVLQIGGRPVGQTSLAEIKTRSQTNLLDPDEANRRAWLKQIPNLLVGYHEKGAFGSPEIQSMTQRTDAWERKNSIPIGKLIDVLEKLKTCVMRVQKEEDEPVGTVEVLRRCGDPLEVRRLHEEDKGRSALSGHMKDLWVNGTMRP